MGDYKPPRLQVLFLHEEVASVEREIGRKLNRAERRLLKKWFDRRIVAEKRFQAEARPYPAEAEMSALEYLQMNAWGGPTLDNPWTEGGPAEVPE